MNTKQVLEKKPNVIFCIVVNCHPTNFGKFYTKIQRCFFHAQNNQCSIMAIKDILNKYIFFHKNNGCRIVHSCPPKNCLVPEITWLR